LGYIKKKGINEMADIGYFVKKKTIPRPGGVIIASLKMKSEIPKET